jgi:hypothetical protein
VTRGKERRWREVICTLMLTDPAAALIPSETLKPRLSVWALLSGR